MLGLVPQAAAGGGARLAWQDAGAAPRDGAARWTLCFREEAQERAFVAAGHARLTSRFCVWASVAAVSGLVVAAAPGFDFRTSFGSYVSDHSTEEVVVLRNTILILGICCYLPMAAVLSKWKPLVRRVGPCEFEKFVVFNLSLVMVACSLQHPRLLARALGVNCDKCTWKDSGAVYLALLLGVCYSSLNALAPVRWHLTLPAALASVVVHFLSVSLADHWVEGARSAAGLAAVLAAASYSSRERQALERRLFAQLSEASVLPAKLAGVAVAEGRDDPPTPVHCLEGLDAEAVVQRLTTPTDAEKEGDAPVEPNVAEVREQLEAVARTGLDERWLLPLDAVKGLVSEAAGPGAGALVLGGRFRGAAVALEVSRYPLKAKDFAHGADRLVNEIRRLHNSRHPNLQPIYGCVVVPDHLEMALVYEDVPGTRLDAWSVVPPHGPPSAQRWKVASDLSGALYYLHSMLPVTVHGDIKDTNVIIQDFGVAAIRAKLLNLGLTRCLNKQAPIVGADIWTAPELVRAAHLGKIVKPTMSTDVFSFGRLLYMIVTGYKPMRSCSKDLLLQVALETLPVALDWPDVPLRGDFQGLIDRCVEVEPTMRPSMGEVHLWIREHPAPGAQVERAGSLLDRLLHAREADMGRELSHRPLDEESDFEPPVFDCADLWDV